MNGLGLGLTGSRRDNRNNKNKKPMNNKPKNSLGRFSTGFMDTLYSSNLGTFGKKHKETRVEKAEKDFHNTQNNASAMKAQVRVDQAVLDDFVEAYTSNKSDSQFITELMRSQIVRVSDVMVHYFDNRYADIVESMNNVVRLMTTKVFTLNLMTIVKNHEEVFNDWEMERLSIGSLISLALVTHHMQMIEETKSLYVEMIAEYIYKFEIQNLMTKYHLTEDAVTELVIDVPYFGRTMTDAYIKFSHNAIFEMLLNHGDCAADYLNAENQKNLFYELFIDEDRVSVKAVGQCLSNDLIEFVEEEGQEQNLGQILYGEYVEMLYQVLNEHDLADIKVALNFILRTMMRKKKEESDCMIIFNTKRAITYPNIRKAIVDFIKNNESAREYFDA